MRRSRGFTLIEILIALTMFAVIGGGLLQLFNQGLRAARLADDRVGVLVGIGEAQHAGRDQAVVLGCGRHCRV